MSRRTSGGGRRIRFTKDLVAFGIILLGVAIFFLLDYILSVF